MAISQLIGRGIGFSPGAPKYIVTHGLLVASALGDPIATYRRVTPVTLTFRRVTPVTQTFRRITQVGGS